MVFGFLFLSSDPKQDRLTGSLADVQTKDGLHVVVNWNAVYRANLFITKKEKEQIENSLEMFIVTRLHVLAIEYTADSLYDTSLNMDTIKVRFARDPQVKQLDKNVKEIRLISVLYPQEYIDKRIEREDQRMKALAAKQEFIADSIRKVTEKVTKEYVKTTKNK